MENEKRFNPMPGDIWRSAEGWEAMIIAVKQKYGERDFTVVYGKSGGYDFELRDMPLSEFMDEVDSDNYKCSQKYLFEFVRNDDEFQ